MRMILTNLYRQFNKTHRNTILFILILITSYFTYIIHSNNKNMERCKSQFYTFYSIVNVDSEKIHSIISRLCISCEKGVNFDDFFMNKRYLDHLQDGVNSHVFHSICEVINYDNLYCEMLCLKLILSCINTLKVAEDERLLALNTFLRRKINSQLMKRVLYVVDNVILGRTEFIHSNQQMNCICLVLGSLSNNSTAIQDISVTEQCIANI